MRLHVGVVLAASICVSACWIEVIRALDGNSLSWAYVFEWPLLAIFGIYMWWNFLHEGTTGLRRNRRAKPTMAPEYSGMLSAWQEYQRELAASQKPPTPDGDVEAKTERPT